MSELQLIVLQLMFVVIKKKVFKPTATVIPPPKSVGRSKKKKRMQWCANHIWTKKMKNKTRQIVKKN